MGWGAWGLPWLEVGWPTANPDQRSLPACVAFGGAGFRCRHEPHAVQQQP